MCIWVILLKNIKTHQLFQIYNLNLFRNTDLTDPRFLNTRYQQKKKKKKRAVQYDMNHQDEIRKYF